MGEDVVFIDFNELFGSRDRFVYPAATEQRHAQAVQSILVIGVDLQGLSVLLNSLIQVIVAECVDRLLEIFFFRHHPPFYREFQFLWKIFSFDKIFIRAIRGENSVAAPN